MKKKPREATRTTLTEILGSPTGARYLGDHYPRWGQGRSNKPSKSIEDAEHEADLLARALRRDDSDDAGDLADVLDECTPRRSCTSGACPICQTAAQRVIVDATQNTFRNSTANWVMANVVYVDAALEEDALDGELFDPLRRRLDQALRDCGVPAFGGFDVSANRHERDAFDPFWCPHAVIFAPARLNEPSVKKRFQTWFPSDDTTPHPVQIKGFDGRPSGRAYALKPDFFERISLKRRRLADGSRSTYSTRLKPIWGERRVDLALAFDGAGLDERLYLRGFELVVRNRNVEIVRTASQRPLERRTRPGDRDRPRPRV
jgi:hypothetical protein